MSLPCKAQAAFSLALVFCGTRALTKTGFSSSIAQASTKDFLIVSLLQAFEIAIAILFFVLLCYCVTVLLFNKA